MDIREFSPHIFWSYDKHADINPEIVVRRVVAHGEIKDMILLTRKIEKNRILESIENWKERNKHEKHINFFKRVILG